MIIILSDLLVDIAMKFQSFPVEAGQCQGLSYLEIGPGGANNIAIMAARMGLPVKCLGEIGDDTFGEIVLSGLRREGIDVEDIIVSEKVQTPVAVVLVDKAAEPAYLGSPGSLQVKRYPTEWDSSIKNAEALFADGWVEHDAGTEIILSAFQLAENANVPVFFDPGPMNPALDPAWAIKAIELTDVLLVNEEEARRLTNKEDTEEAAKNLLTLGPKLVVLKRGRQGITFFTAENTLHTPAFPVEVVDKTGAGDSVTGAILYGYLKGLGLSELGLLANAVGAAKVQKLGTGHNLPTLDEVRSIAARFEVKLPINQDN